MAVKVFITGATGYIGGDALYALQQAHPDYEYTALVRNSDSGAKIAAVHPSVRFVYGTLDDSDLITEEASKADIILHTADSSDHVGAANAIAAGLAKGHTSTLPGFWIHVSGTGILTWSDSQRKRYGEALDYKPYDDLDGVGALTSLPDEAFHRNVDKIVLAVGAGTESGIKTAIVCPPTIYGTGRGAGNRRSRQTNKLIAATFQHGCAPVVGAGLAEWDHVHVTDLSDLFVRLVERAARWTSAQASDDDEIWGPRGYFLAENGRHVWSHVAREVGRLARDRGLLESHDSSSASKKQAKDDDDDDIIAAVTIDQALEWGGFDGESWAMNSRGRARRARQYLDWKPSGPSLMHALPDIIDAEAVHAGLVKGHGQKVAEATV